MKSLYKMIIIGEIEYTKEELVSIAEKYNITIKYTETFYDGYEIVLQKRKMMTSVVQRYGLIVLSGVVYNYLHVGVGKYNPTRYTF